MSGSVVSPVFIGREEEMTALAQLLDRARARDTGFALISGEAGVGKTRLVRELADRAADLGFLVLTGQCVELGAEGLPLAPLVDALRTLVRTMRPDALADVLGPAAEGLARLLPELAAGTTVGPAAVDLQKAQLLEHVLGALGRLGEERPVLLVIEDLHWADQSTLDLMAFLIRSLRDARVLLATTYRSDELHRRHPLRPLLTAWERMRTVDRVELDRFDRGEVAAQLAAILGDGPVPAVADAVFDRSGGNAYLVEELAGLVRNDRDLDDLSPSLLDVLLSRVDALSVDAQKLLRTACVAGRAVSDRLLATVAGFAEAELYATLRETVDNHLLVVDPSGYGYTFRHALTRDAVYEDMLPGERVRLHAAYGDALAADPRMASDPGTLPATIAHHWYAALDLPRALPATIDAARAALTSYGPAEALRHLERALEIWPRVPDAEERTGLDQIEVSRLAADAAFRSGALDRARSLIADALAQLPAGAKPERRALLLERSAIIARDQGESSEAAAMLRQALALLPDDGVTRARAQVLASLAGALMRADEMPQSIEVARQAIDAARSVGATDLEADASITLGVLAYTAGKEAGLEPLREGLRLALTFSADNPWTALRGYVNYSDTLEMLGRHAEAAEVAGEGIKLAARFGVIRTLGSYLIGNRAEPLLRLGEWDEVDQMTAEALRALPEGVFAGTLHQIRAELAAMRGRYDEASRELKNVRRSHRRHGGRPVHPAGPVRERDDRTGRRGPGGGARGRHRCAWRHALPGCRATAGRCCGWACGSRPTRRPGSATDARTCPRGSPGDATRSPVSPPPSSPRHRRRSATRRWWPPSGPGRLALTARRPGARPRKHGGERKSLTRCPTRWSDWPRSTRRPETETRPLRRSSRRIPWRRGWARPRSRKRPPRLPAESASPWKRAPRRRPRQHRAATSHSRPTSLPVSA